MLLKMFLGDISRDPAVKIQWCLEIKDPQNSKPFKTHGFRNEIHSIWTAFGPWSYLLRNPATAEIECQVSPENARVYVEFSWEYQEESQKSEKIFRNDMSFNKRKRSQGWNFAKIWLSVISFWRLVCGLILSLFMENLWPEKITQMKLRCLVLYQKIRSHHLSLKWLPAILTPGRGTFWVDHFPNFPRYVSSLEGTPWKFNMSPLQIGLLGPSHKETRKSSNILHFQGLLLEKRFRGVCFGVCGGGIASFPSWFPADTQVVVMPGGEFATVRPESEGNDRKSPQTYTKTEDWNIFWSQVWRLKGRITVRRWILNIVRSCHIHPYP